MPTLNTFILLTATPTLTTIKREQAFPFSWQRWLRQRTAMQRRTYIVHLVITAKISVLLSRFTVVIICGGAVGWGTVLPARWSRVRFQSGH